MILNIFIVSVATIKDKIENNFWRIFYINFSNLSFFTLQIGQTSGGSSLAHK